MKAEIMDLEKDLNLKYAKAPYNFVPFPAKAVNRYNLYDDLPKHNTCFDKNKNALLSGTIEYEIVAKTPVIVAENESSEGLKTFFKNAEGNFSIPGNSIRGVLRKNTQILSMSSPVNENKTTSTRLSDIENRRLLYRDVASNNSLSEIYKKILGINPLKRLAENIRSGYIRKGNDSDYIITESEKIFNGYGYTRISELNLRKIVDKSIEDKIHFMYKKEIMKFEDEIRKLNRERNIGKKLEIIEKNKIKNANPYFLEVSFEYDEKKHPTKISEKGRLKNEGILLTGGFIIGKMSHYLVAAPNDDSHSFTLSKEDVFNYEKDYKMTKKKASFYKLPDDGSLKHVFYIEKDNQLHFGFTPYLRLFYKNDILKGVKNPLRYVDGISYEKSLYGFSGFELQGNEYDYKSRLSFEDAVLVEGKESKEIFHVILGEPKPTSYTLYLKQKLDTDKKHLITYEDDNFELRGYKEYWLKDYIENTKVDFNKVDSNKVDSNKVDSNKDNVSSKLNPLDEGSRFKGKIHFKNLNRDELGLVLWSLMLNEDSYQSIGMGKPYGFGRVEIENVKLKLEDLDKKYGEFSFDYYTSDSPLIYIDEYKKYFSKTFLNGENIEENNSIKTFLYMKKYVVDKNDRDYYSYMPLKEFRNKKILPDALSYKNKIKDKNVPNNTNQNRVNQNKGKPKYNNPSNNQNDNSRNSKKQKSNSFGTTIDLSGLKLNDEKNNKKKK